MIAIHGGAGVYRNNEHKLCSQILKQCNNLVDAVMKLECCGVFNCGQGSSLTYNGKVECEAAYMTSEKLAFGAIGGVSNCANPVYAAKLLSMVYESKLDVWELIPPSVLIGAGANAYCAEIFPPDKIVENSQLCSKMAKMQHSKALVTLQQNNERLDTVGGVTIMSDGRAEACVSTGGFILKKSGRISHCCQFGAGIWSEKRDQKSVAISLSGCGEAIFRTHLAQKIGEFFLEMQDILTSFFIEKLRVFLIENFVHSPKLEYFPVNRRLFGGLLLIQNDYSKELIVFHNTENFVFAFSNGAGVKRHLSCLPESTDILCEAFSL